MWNRIKCFLGLHKWREQRLVEWPMSHVVAFIMGDVCIRCGKVKQNILEITSGLPQTYNIVNPNKKEKK